jgi:hypothetical protein
MACPAASMSAPTKAWVGIVAAVALAGCYDEFANLTFVNATRGPIAVVTRPSGSDAKRSRVEAGMESKRVFPTGPEPSFEIEAGGCSYGYLLPEMGVNFAWRIANGRGGSEPDYSSGYPVRTQLMPNFELYLLPPKAKGLQRLEQLREVQGHGFPLKPISKVCR